NFSKPFRLVLLVAGIGSVAVIGLTSIVESSGFGWKSLANKIKSEDSVSVTKGHATVLAAGRAKPFFNFQDGHQIFASFSGAAAQALQSGQAQARALASGDIDGNSSPDVVAGYAAGGTGVVTIQRGNPEAYAPQDTSVFERMQNGYNPDAL